MGAGIVRHISVRVPGDVRVLSNLLNLVLDGCEDEPSVLVYHVGEGAVHFIKPPLIEALLIAGRMHTAMLVSGELLEPC